MLQQQADGSIAGPPSTNERLLVHAGLVTSIITHIIIGTIRSGEEVTDTTEETMEAVEEAAAATADPVVAWAIGQSRRQDVKDQWR